MSTPLSNPSPSETENTAAHSARFAVVCRCGWTSRGDREETALEIECDGCGARQFVLPKDVYPSAEARSKTKKPPRRKPPASRSEPTGGSVPSGGIKRSPKLKPTPEPDSDPTTTATQIKIPKKHRGGIISPIRLLIVLGIITFAATIFWSIRRSALHAAEREFKSHSDAGFVYLRERKFGKAADEFRLAVQALERLDRDDAKAREVRQMLRESQAIDELSPSSLYEMLARFDERSLTDDELTKEFDGRYANRWIVLATTLHRDSRSGSVTLDFPLSVGDAPVELTGELDVFRKLPLSEKPKFVILAAQLQSCRRVNPAAPRWQICLDSKSAFLWTDLGNFRAMGLGDAEEDGGDAAARDRRVLAEQARILGLNE